METRLKSVRITTGCYWQRNCFLLRADAYNMGILQQLSFDVKITESQFNSGEIEASAQEAIDGLEAAIVEQFGSLEGFISPPPCGDGVLAKSFVVGDQESAKV